MILQIEEIIQEIVKNDNKIQNKEIYISNKRKSDHEILEFIERCLKTNKISSINKENN